MCGVGWYVLTVAVVGVELVRNKSKSKSKKRKEEKNSQSLRQTTRTIRELKENRWRIPPWHFNFNKQWFDVCYVQFSSFQSATFHNQIEAGRIESNPIHPIAHLIPYHIHTNAMFKKWVATSQHNATYRHAMSRVLYLFAMLVLIARLLSFRLHPPPSAPLPLPMCHLFNSRLSDFLPVRVYPVLPSRRRVSLVTSRSQSLKVIRNWSRKIPTSHTSIPFSETRNKSVHEFAQAEGESGTRRWRQVLTIYSNLRFTTMICHHSFYFFWKASIFDQMPRSCEHDCNQQGAEVLFDARRAMVANTQIITSM